MEVLEKISVLIYIGVKIYTLQKLEFWFIRGLQLSPLQATATLLESLLFFFLQVTHCGTSPERGRRRNGGILFSICPTAPFRNGDSGKNIYRTWLFKSERKDHPPTSSSSSEGFHFFLFFCCAQAQLLAAGFCFLVKKQDLPLSKAQGQHSLFLYWPIT